MMKKIKMKCKQCGKKRDYSPAEIKDGKGKFCSRKCKGRWMSENIKGKNHPNWITGRSKCIDCDKRLSAYPGSKNKGNRCLTCYIKFNKGENHSLWKGKVKIVCEICGKEKKVYPYRVKNGKVKFCSIECKNKWMSKNIRGKNHYNWQGGITPERNKDKSKTWRKAVFERDHFTCLICGEVGGYLNAHHIKNWASHPKLRYDIDNGMAMCQKCHKLVDKELPLFSIKKETSKSNVK